MLMDEIKKKEKLYEYAEEALDIREEYEALTEEQQARIPKEELTKLTAWVEFAETFSQTGMTLAAETHTHSGSGSGIAFTMWNNASSLPTQAGNWCLSKNVTLTSAYQIPGDVNLCLNGHTISGSAADKPIEVVIGIPEELKEDGREFYIIRAHEGEYTLLQDLDNDPNSITISTDRFSSYAIAYEEADGAGGTHKCGLCHICPTFLGVCCFIWLAVIVAVILAAVILVLRRKKD